MLKKIVSILIAALLLLGLCACSPNNNETGGNAGSVVDSQHANNGNNGSTTAPQQGNNEPSTGDGAVVGVKSDVYAPSAGSQAEKYWHVKEIQDVYAFSSDGKCTVRDTVYYLKNTSDYEEAAAELTGGNFPAVWSDDKSYFSIDRGFKDYTSVDDAIAEIEKDFRGYTLTYGNGGSKHVDPPTDERKTELMKEVFGFTMDDIKTSYGDFEYAIRKKEKVLVTYSSNATVEDINALARVVYEVCAPVADEGKTYDYLGKYGKEITAAPETDSIFNSAQFNYFKNGKEISIQSEILNSEGYDNTLALLIAVVS